MSLDYRELRWHTEYSIMVGCGRIGEHAKRARDLGWDSICLTETDTMRHVYYEHECLLNMNLEVGAAPLRPIYGTEISVCPDMDVRGLSDEARAELAKEHTKATALRKAVYAEERRLGLTRTSKLVLRAMSYRGLKNLYKITSQGWHRGYFIRPRIDLKLLEEYNEDISISIGGTTGLVCDDILAGDMTTAMETLERLQKTFAGRMWLEIQPHEGEQHAKLNKAMMLISRQMDIPVVAVNDVHYVHAEDTDAHTIILCLRSHRNIQDPEHPRSPPGYHVRTGEEMLEAFQANHPRLPLSFVRDAIKRTVEVANAHQVKMEIDRFKALVPAVPLDDDVKTDHQQVIKMCLAGWDWRKMEERIKEQARLTKADPVELRQVYEDRLKSELAAIKRQKFSRYFLVVFDVINWARRQDIMVGPGRGSSAGSIICFLMGITSLDPIEHGLMFERFISPGRIDMPDIDMDYEDNRREEVIRYLHDRYGHDNVCHIGTHGRLRGKAALKDVCRVLDIPLHRVNAVTNSIVERSSGDERVSQTVEDSFKEFKVCQDFDKDFPQVLPLVKKLEGSARQVGVHAAGIIPCPERLDDIIPIERHERHGKWVTITAMDMYGSEAHGLLKLDILGLRTLSILADARRKIMERHRLDVNFEELPLNDKKVLKMFTDAEYVGIFQYDSTGARAACEGIEFTNFEDVAALTALNRPGTMRSGLATEYKRRKQDPKKIKPLHPIVDAICADTLGVLVYQEHVLKIFIQVAGYEPGTADSLRKKIAKKWGDEAVGKEREKFIEGAVKNGMSAIDAAKLMDNITFFGSYGFNKSHASAYGVISYWGMWLKKYYPVEFVWALMKNEPERSEVARFAKEAERLGIQCLQPDVNVSGEIFNIDKDGNVRGSLSDLKNVGKAAITSIQATQPYTSITDFLERVPRKAANSRVIDALIKAGALRTLLPNTKWALENKDSWLEVARKGKVGWQETVTKMVEASKSEEEYTNEDLMHIAAEVSPLGGGKHRMFVYHPMLAEHSSNVPWVTMEDSDFWRAPQAFVRGVMIEIKYNQVGDFDTVEPSDEKKAKMGWGKRYANINVEDETGQQKRIKVDIDIFEEFRHIIDRGVGTCVALHVANNQTYHSSRCHFMADLEEMRQKLRANIPLIGWERCFTNEHPVWAHSQRDILAKFKETRNGHPFMARGLITSVKQIWTKKGDKMCFFGLQDGLWNTLDVTVFPNDYEGHASEIRRGSVVKVKLRRDGKNVVMDESGINAVLGSIT